MNSLKNIVSDEYHLDDESFLKTCKKSLDDNGIVVLPDFMDSNALKNVAKEGEEKKHLAFYTMMAMTILPKIISAIVLSVPKKAVSPMTKYPKTHH